MVILSLLFLVACSDKSIETIGPTSVQEILKEFPYEITEIKKFPFEIGGSMGYIIKNNGIGDHSVTLRYYAEGVEIDYEHPFNITGESIEYTVGTEKNLIEEIQKTDSLESFRKIKLGDKDVYYNYFPDGESARIVWWDGKFERNLAYLESPKKLNKNKFKIILRSIFEEIND